MSDTDSLHVIVLVLGDLGRSPRMQYHALSLLQSGHTVSLLGYEGESLIPDLCDATLSHRLHVVRFSVPSPKILRKVLLFHVVWRAVTLCIYLLRALFVSVPSISRKKVDCIIVQNPPALPLLLVAFCYCRLQRLASGARARARPAFIIDWHNLGFSMLTNSILRNFVRNYERIMAPCATGHFCVTASMKAFLHDEFKVPRDNIQVLYDCPPSMFQPTSVDEQHRLLSKLHGSLCAACPRHWYENFDTPNQTLFTEVTGDGSHMPRKGRPALVTSSTSWTADEDFGVLLDALVSLEETINRSKSSLRVVVVITGKGPQKSFYEEKISRLCLNHIAIQTLWLEPADYPRLLACADLGISLHTSTSGMDLPMKILDLFGCLVPVCARNFDCLSELVQDDKNGRTFDSSETLACQMWALLEPLSQDPTISHKPHSYGDLKRYSKALESRQRWDENWKNHALPMITDSVLE